MREDLYGFIEELNYYYGPDNKRAQLATVESIDDENLQRVMAHDGIKPGSKVLVFISTRVQSKAKLAKDQDMLDADAMDEDAALSEGETRVLKKLKAFQEYEIIPVPDEVSYDFYLDENQNINMSDSRNLAAFKKIVIYNLISNYFNERSSRVYVNKEIAQKIKLKDVYPLPAEEMESLLKILTKYISEENREDLIGEAKENYDYTREYFKDVLDSYNSRKWKISNRKNDRIEEYENSAKNSSHKSNKRDKIKNKKKDKEKEEQELEM